MIWIPVGWSLKIQIQAIAQLPTFFAIKSRCIAILKPKNCKFDQYLAFGRCDFQEIALKWFYKILKFWKFCNFFAFFGVTISWFLVKIIEFQWLIKNDPEIVARRSERRLKAHDPYFWKVKKKSSFLNPLCFLTRLK